MDVLVTKEQASEKLKAGVKTIAQQIVDDNPRDISYWVVVQEVISETKCKVYKDAEEIEVKVLGGVTNVGDSVLMILPRGRFEERVVIARYRADPSYDLTIDNGSSWIDCDGYCSGNTFFLYQRMLSSASTSYYFTNTANIVKPDDVNIKFNGILGRINSQYSTHHLCIEYDGSLKVTINATRSSNAITIRYTITKSSSNNEEPVFEMLSLQQPVDTEDEESIVETLNLEQPIDTEDIVEEEI